MTQSTKRLQPTSRAGRIRAALDQLGWNAPWREVAEFIGPLSQNECISFKGDAKCRFNRNSALVTFEQVAAVRRQFRTRCEEMITSKVKQAFDKYGWETPSAIISAHVGPVEQARGTDLTSTTGTGGKKVVALLPPSRVGQIRRVLLERLQREKARGEKEAELKRAADARDAARQRAARQSLEADESTPEIEANRIRLGIE